MHTGMYEERRGDLQTPSTPGQFGLSFRPVTRLPKHGQLNHIAKMFGTGQPTVDIFDAESIGPGLVCHNIQGKAGREIRGGLGCNGDRDRRSDQSKRGGGEGR